VELRTDALLAIAGMALVTFALRAGGLLLAERLPRRGRWQRALGSLPGAVLVAIVVPNVIGSGPLGMGAAAAVAAVAVRSRNLLAAMATGVVLVAAGRLAGLG
jgi:uncharacterized membrane protein